jgi:hypothetical protein
LDTDGRLSEGNSGACAWPRNAWEELSDADDTLVIVDGPLTFEEPIRGAAVGYIKRIFKLYLPREHLGLLARLKAGERTPLFALRSSRRFVRFSWFVRLADPHLGDSELAGIARLEVSETVGVEAARRLANATTALFHDSSPTLARSTEPAKFASGGALRQIYAVIWAIRD